jgi:hypothetical protein
VVHQECGAVAESPGRSEKYAATPTNQAIHFCVADLGNNRGLSVLPAAVPAPAIVVGFELEVGLAFEAEPADHVPRMRKIFSCGANRRKAKTNHDVAM